MNRTHKSAQIRKTHIHTHLTLHGPHHLVGVGHGVSLSRKVLLSQQPPLLGGEVALSPRKRLPADETPVAPQPLRPRQRLPENTVRCSIPWYRGLCGVRKSQFRRCGCYDRRTCNSRESGSYRAAIGRCGRLFSSSTARDATRCQRPRYQRPRPADYRRLSAAKSPRTGSIVPTVKRTMLSFAAGMQRCWSASTSGGEGANTLPAKVQDAPGCACVHPVAASRKRVYSVTA